MRLSHSSWCNFANNLKDWADHRIIFVSRHVETAERTVAACPSRSRKEELSFTSSDFGPSNASASVHYRSGTPPVVSSYSRARIAAVAGSSKGYTTLLFKP
ncbi:hypothetical protein A0H81_05677 [Grifola frondosa]|uniref:Uncharacterized protein n=1 Tax=Grifola frondosa TaxID=5627 RepID=A0A1C7MCE6_GRIFR|nr:hypothetical protein A0H81_05677 [Grifola frondosa]